MKTQSQFIRIVSFLLSMVMLTNCTVYNVVQSPPSDLKGGKKTTLYKDGLVFHLVNTAVRNEALYGELSYPNTQPARKSSMNVYLKPGEETSQDSLGVLEVQFESIAYIENYVKDPKKSRNQTIIAVTGTILGSAVLFIILASISLSNMEMNFRVEEH